jgi:membrane-associated phospholipid phosphatase
MFVGAHLPLDVVGGAGLGMMIASVVGRLDEAIPGAAASSIDVAA